MKSIILLCIYLLEITTADDHCSVRSSCDQCIQEPGCAWIKEANNENGCTSAKTGATENSFNPESIITIVRSEPLSEKIKISPQEVRLTLRLREPVFFNITINGDDGIAPPRFQNIIVDMTRSQPDNIAVKVEALQCPDRPSKSHEALELVSYQSQQTISLDAEILCTCPSN